MEQLISKMQQLENFHQQIQKWCTLNTIQEPKIMSYPLQKVSKLYDNFLQKYGSKQMFVSSNKNQNQPIWFENQLILFQWAVISLSFNLRILLKDFGKKQIEWLASIFREKQQYIVNYEIKCMIIKGKQIRNTWKPQEQELLAYIIQEMPDKNKWNEIARQLFKVSKGKYFRQGKHCRQRWYSYIENKNIQYFLNNSRREWNIEDDIELLQLVSVRGKKWNQIMNKFTNVQNKAFLKKRLKMLLRQAKSKHFSSDSQRQAINSVLQKKYEFIQTIKKQKRPSSHKIKIRENNEEQNYQFRRSLPNEYDQINRKYMKQENYQNDMGQPGCQINNSTGLTAQNIQANFQEIKEFPSPVFNSSLHYYPLIPSWTNFPIQYIPQNNLMLNGTAQQYFRYGNIQNPYFFTQPYNFY